MFDIRDVTHVRHAVTPPMFDIRDVTHVRHAVTPPMFDVTLTHVYICTYIPNPIPQTLNPDS